MSYDIQNPPSTRYWALGPNTQSWVVAKMAKIFHKRISILIVTIDKKANGCETSERPHTACSVVVVAYEKVTDRLLENFLIRNASGSYVVLEK